jgi:hypothetical protein
MTSNPTILFVPGAWHPPSSFDLLASQLKSNAYETAGVKLASVGANPPLKSFAPDVEAIQSHLHTLCDQGKDILVFVHSYGGIIGSEAIKGYIKSEREKQGKKGGVTHLYFCCAFVLPEGASLWKALQEKPLPWFDIAEDQRTLNAMTPEKIFYNDISDSKAYVESLEAHSFNTFKSEVTYPGWMHVPCTYLLCKADKAIPIEAQRGMVQQAIGAGGNFAVQECEASHSPFISMPGLVAESVRRAAGEKV